MGNNAVISYLLSGSNVGDRRQHLETALDLISNHFDVITTSSIYETESWGDRMQEAYLNQVILIRVDKSAHQLHSITRAIEKKMGRKEKGNYLPRTIDIDILFFGDEIILTEKLIIPHPRIQIRRFVLTPMCEIAEDHIHPVLAKSIKKLLSECEDQLQVSKYEA